VEHSSRYIVLFAAAVCAVCSVIVASAAVSLKDRQERNKALDVQRKVLALAGIEEEALSDEQVETTYAERIDPRIIVMETGEYADVDPTGWDQQAVMADPETSVAVPENPARVRRLPSNSVVYHVRNEAGEVESVILPIQGQGLWGTLFGYFAIEGDGQTVKGITFYAHKETPGLGAEVDNPGWKALWPGRKIYGEDGAVAIRVKKGRAGPVAQDPFQVDGLSGATITSRGVSNTLAFWLGDDAFGPYIHRQLKASGGGS
jgi:Na+-transporting NADH:ubiquinone oxidoreductase subunit C